MAANNATAEIHLVSEKFHRTITDTDAGVVDTTIISSVRIDIIVSRTGDADVIQPRLHG
jgi:hypothetical protein